MILPAVLSQIGYPGAGDIDDCWVVASVWAAVAADPNAPQPTVPAFRAAAGNPDRPGPTGGDLDDVVRGSVRTWPYLTIAKYASTDWATFDRRLSDGWSASLGVLSAELPVYLRFGFNGSHQVGVAKTGPEFMVANPLAKDGSRPLPCPLNQLRTAAREHGQGTILAALYKPWEATDVKFIIPDGARELGTATTTRDTQLWRWDGARIPLAKGTARAVFGEAKVGSFKVYVIRTGGAQEGHYLKQAHATPIKAPTDVKRKVVLKVEGQPDYTTEV